MTKTFDGWPDDDDRRQREMPIQPKTMKDVLELWETDNGKAMQADRGLVDAVRMLKLIREKIQEYKEMEQKYLDGLAVCMKNNSVLVNEHGEELIAWRKTSDSERFDAKQFQKDYPELYKEYLKTQLGTRRFLVK